VIKFLLFADFPLKNTGIFSTAERIISNFESSQFEVYCDQSIFIAGKYAKELSKFSQGQAKVVIFTHLECRQLSSYCRQLSGAVIHVGDWPGAYWLSKLKYTKRVWQILGWVRFHYRICMLPRDALFLFVNESDTKSAIAYGFKYSRTLEIGVIGPTVALAEDFKQQHLCFTGNYRYAPNKDAAVRLIEWVRSYPQFNLSLVGYHAEDLHDVVPENVTLHDSIPSVVEYLARERPIYVSLLGFGAGAKNKMLEAMVSACPIIATPQSLDPSLKSDSIMVINDLDELLPACSYINDNYGRVNLDSIKTSYSVIAERSWNQISSKLLSFL
jgi:hypothetical protein